MLDSLDATTEPSVHPATVWACTLASNAAVDPARLVQLAEQAVATDPTSPWGLCVLGIAHYRAGQLDQAIRRLDESIQIPPRDCECVHSWLALAMAYHRQGEEEEAHSWLDKALGWTQKHKLARPSDPTESGAMPFYYAGKNIDCLIRLREAEQLLGISAQDVRATTEKDAFVVPAGDGAEVAKFDTLAEAAVGSTAGDTIEIRCPSPPSFDTPFGRGQKDTKSPRTVVKTRRNSTPIPD